jgi:DedD protein
MPLRSEVSREKSAPSRAEEGGISVQVGAFKNSGNAERLAQLLSRKGFDARVEKSSVDGSDFYKVQVGRYASRAEADQAASRLKALGYPTKISGS